MNAKLLLTSFFIYLLFVGKIHAQVTIGNDANPTAGAVLDLGQVPLKNLGLMLPKVELTNLSSWAPLSGTPVDGMFVYNTNAVGLALGIYYWKTNQWVTVAASADISNAWLAHGNTGTNPNDPTNPSFVGTIDTQDLALRTGNTEKMRVTNAGNVGIGTTSPNPSAILDVSTSTNKAVALPLVALTSTTDISTVPNPSQGMIVYNTTKKYINVWDGAQWVIPVLEIPGIVTPQLVGVAKSSTDVTDASRAVVYFNTKVLDPENKFTGTLATGSTYTVAKSALHQIFVNLTCFNVTTGQAWYLRILKNGTPIAAMDATAAAGASAVVFAIDNFLAGDVITVDRGGSSSGWEAELTKIAVFRFD